MRSVLLFFCAIMSIVFFPSQMFAQKPPASMPPTANELKAVASVLQKAYAGEVSPEAVQMLKAIAEGSMMGPGEGWFGPAKTRYTFAWLAKAHGVPEDGAIDGRKFRGQPEWFAILDRNHDGVIEATDLDWSNNNPWVQQASLVNRIFSMLDQKADGKVTLDEMKVFIDRLSLGKGSFTARDLRDLVLSDGPPMAGPPAGGPPSGGPPSGHGDAPSPEMLIRALFRNEIGSLQEGPAIDSPAPDFRLQTQDGAEQIHLADRFDGTKPTVLVFGNFTCGPFRRMYPAVDEVCQLWKDDAHFLGVYVREAHPRDGWKMESNTRMGVDIPQPTNYEERKAVAQTCATTLKWSMPLVVDEIHDPVGSTYSGMPARLYVIDSQGKVAYKSGRGPFGFKAGEMEQALVMSLLETVLRDSK